MSASRGAGPGGAGPGGAGQRLGSGRGQGAPPPQRPCGPGRPVTGVRGGQGTRLGVCAEGRVGGGAQGVGLGGTQGAGLGDCAGAGLGGAGLEVQS